MGACHSSASTRIVVSLRAESRWSYDAGGALRKQAELILSKRADGSPVVFNDKIPIQIASDLHLEFFDNFRDPVQARELDSVIAPCAPVLALLGDIGIPAASGGVYRHFLLKQAAQFEAVLVITGNHEFYNAEGEERTVDDTEQIIEQICAERPNLHFVDNTCVRLGPEPSSPALLCTPLWSHVPPHAMRQIGGSMNDYRLCYVRPAGQSVELLTPEITSGMHGLAVAWLEDEVRHLQASACGRIAVLSHHTPAMRGTSNPKYEHAGNSLQHAFSSDLVEVYKDKVSVWAYGHTHYNNDQEHLGTRLVSNQRGYRGNESGFLNIAYRPDFVIHV